MIQIIQPVKGSHICRCCECLTTYVCDDEDIHSDLSNVLFAEMKSLFLTKCQNNI